MTIDQATERMLVVEATENFVNWPLVLYHYMQAKAALAYKDEE